MNEWIQRLVEKIEHLDSRMAGVRACRTVHPCDESFRLGPPLSLAELVDLESRYKVTLPDEYREFLLVAGNGGAGLKPFGRTSDDDLGWDSMSFLAVDPEGLARPFPLTQSVLFDDEVAASLPTGVDFCTHIGLRWQKGRYPWDGAFFLHDLGCAIVVLLVVTGPERGNIWIDERANDFGVCKVQDHRTGRTWPSLRGQSCGFPQWYEAYLDGLLLRVESGKWPGYEYYPESWDDPFLEPNADGK